MKFTYTKTIVDQLYDFSVKLGKLDIVMQKFPWKNELIKRSKSIAAITSIITDKNILRKVDLYEQTIEDIDLIERDLEKIEAFLQNLEALRNILDKHSNFSLVIIEELHKEIFKTNKAYKLGVRKGTRRLPKTIWRNNIPRTITLEVKTPPGKIKDKLNEFIKWYRENEQTINPLLLAGIVHFKIAEIHPYNDGNGRLSRLLARSVLYRRGIDTENIIPINDFYLQHYERYYDEIQKAIDTKDLTYWLEFYTEGLVESMNNVMHGIDLISGGTFNLEENKIIDLTEKEREVVDFIKERKQTSGAEVARLMSVTRQNTNTIFLRLLNKGVIDRVGRGVGTRYQLK